MKKKLNIVEQKNENVTHLEKQSEAAINIFSTTIDRLTKANEAIAKEEDEVYVFKMELENTATRLATRRKHNAVMIDKIKKLLEE